MKFEAYLLESNVSGDYNNNSLVTRSKEIDYQKALDIINKKCKNAKISTAIYRGKTSGAQAKAFIIKPAKFLRVSEYTENYYMLLFQLLKKWQNFPKLSRSLIGVSSNDEARIWGTTYRVYPYDGYDIGVCPYEHFWGSFEGTLSHEIGMQQLNDFIVKLLKGFYGEITINADETNPEVLNKELINIANIDDISPDNLFDDSFLKIIRYHLSKNKTVIDAFNFILDPKKFGFEIVNTGSKYKLPNKVQIWTEAPCVLLKRT